MLGSLAARKTGKKGITWKALAGALVAAPVLLPATAMAAVSPATPAPAQYIVSDSAAGGANLVSGLVESVGGLVGLQLPAANGVLASLTPAESALLQLDPAVTVTPNLTVTITGASGPTTLSGAAPAAVFPQQTGAAQLWAQGDTGAGVNVAVVDTGIDPLADFSGRLVGGVDLTGAGQPYSDGYGHGTFVAGLIAGNGASSNGLYKGEAPGAGLISVKVAGANGQTSLATVIEGIGWVIANHVTDNIRVMNLSLGYIPTESTLVDPLDQAVERAWEAGIVVVASAGNEGPFNGTILSPGDDPLVITVGAVNDHGSVSPSVDTMADFSSVGPTNPDGWFKPDLVASGTSVVSLMAPGSTVATDNPQAVLGPNNENFVGSGTSFSTAITSGAVALLLAKHPSLQPDNVKADLLGTASPGPVGNPVVDGHGLLNVAAAEAAPQSVSLSQHFGQVSLSAGVPGSFSVAPGQTVTAGYTLHVGGLHLATVAGLAGGDVSVPVSCTRGGPAVGQIEVDIPTGSYTVPLIGGTAPNPYSAQGSAQAGDLCNGGTMYAAGQGAQATAAGSVTSANTTTPVQVQFYLGTSSSTFSLANATAVPVALVQPGNSVDLGATWSGSAWDPANWSGIGGIKAPASTGSAWNGSAWNGSAWNGSAWNGSAWNGSAWNGSAWNGSAWNGSAWNGSAWNGSAWNGSAWNGQSWGPASS